MSLTKRLVNKPGGRGAGKGAADGTRQRLRVAAQTEFAKRGFAGASVDRIAATARVNKAMIYYHFSSKAALYREILRDMFQAVGRRALAAAESNQPPAEKIGLFVHAISAEAEARPHFPPIWLREVAEGGTHLDAAVLKDMTSVVRSLATIIEDGVRLGRFTPVSPFLVHAGIVAPLMLHFGSRDLRARLERSGLRGAGEVEPALLVEHLRRVALGLLEGRT
ncbi:MAG: TetR/AcrR family transcriptional regulator [Vicinamibacterales bacterium]